MGLALFSALVLFGLIAFAELQLKSLGGDLERIALRDLPLTELITKITVGQFGEAASIERAIRFGSSPRSAG